MSDVRGNGVLLVWAGVVGLGLALVIAGSAAWQWGLGIAVLAALTIALGTALAGAGTDPHDDLWTPYCPQHGNEECSVRTEWCPDQRKLFD